MTPFAACNFSTVRPRDSRMELQDVLRHCVVVPKGPLAPFKLIPIYRLQHTNTSERALPPAFLAK